MMDHLNKDNGFKASADVASPNSEGGINDRSSILNRKMTKRGFLQSASRLYAASTIIHVNSTHAELDESEDEGEEENEGGEGGVTLTSPATTPWQIHLPIDIQYLSHPINNKLSPEPTEEANTAFFEAGRNKHQFWGYVTDEVRFPHFKDNYYELFAVQFNNWMYSPSYPRQIHWGYQGTPDVSEISLDSLDKMMPSVIVAANYGQPLLCRMHNKLPVDHIGFGTPEISTHLHNLHCASESDGYPGDYYSSEIHGPTLTQPGVFKDHLYINLKAGFAHNTQCTDGLGDPTEALGTLFYHDHTENFTGPNVYRGLAGFYLLFDELDSGDENDPNERALRLPSGNYDYPFSIGDRIFDKNGMLYYDQLNSEGVLGDKVVINGRIEPVWHVSRRRYRMRLLNSGPSRFYDLAIVDKNNIIQPFIYIANDGNLLEKPLMNTRSVYLGVAERADIIMDFSNIPAGEDLYLVNRLTQISTRKPDKIVLPGQRIMKIVINPADVSDPSVKLTADTLLRPLPDKFKLTEDDIKDMNVKVRRWEFARSGGGWTVNDKIFDVDKPVVKVKKGTAEIWELINKSGGWAHPIHIHFEEGRVLSKIVDGEKVPVPPHERGRKDVFVLEPNSETRIYIEFRDFTGKYVMHCHNTIHEDHAMMVRWDIEDD